jgi:hypothetical protein
MATMQRSASHVFGEPYERIIMRNLDWKLFINPQGERILKSSGGTLSTSRDQKLRLSYLVLKQSGGSSIMQAI